MGRDVPPPPPPPPKVRSPHPHTPKEDPLDNPNKVLKLKRVQRKKNLSLATPKPKFLHELIPVYTLCRRNHGNHSHAHPLCVYIACMNIIPCNVTCPMQSCCIVMHQRHHMSLYGGVLTAHLSCYTVLAPVSMNPFTL